MKNYLLIITLSLTIAIQLTQADISLQEQNESQDQLNPVNEDATDDSTNKHDKRTIFGPHKDVGWVKHVYIKNGHKKLLGYSPLDYKFAAIPRPVIVKPPTTGYYYPKPVKVPAPVKPVIDNTGWKPIVSKPGHIDLVHRPHIDVVQQRPSHIDFVHQPHVDVVEQKPHIDLVHQPHIDVVHNQHVDQVNLPPHIHQVPLDGHIHVQSAPGHLGHVHLQPTGHLDVIQPAGIHLHQAAPVHVDQIHQINIPHNGHIDAVTHIDHVHPHAHLIRGVIPAPTVFEVTKPNLGVLPLGAAFPATVSDAHLRHAPISAVHVHSLVQQPHVYLQPHVHSAVAEPHVHVQPHAHHLIPEPHVHALPHIHQLIPEPHLHPQPHIHQAVAEPQPHVHALLPETHLHPQPHVHQIIQEPHLHPQPHLHTQQPGVLIEHHGNLAHRIINQHPHQHLPVEDQNFLQQPLPAQLQLTNQQGLWEQIPAQAANLNIPQQALPLEGEQHVQHLPQNHLIQPGQTDVQIPFHLPHHPGWQNENIVKPSPTLEPPYKK